jgi:predicted component of type VI protein secretion system
MQPGASFRLIVRRGPQPNQQYELTRDTITIGRDITNDIVINDAEVSRHHARLVRTAAGFTIEDLRSTNGTFVNRQRITAPYQLSNGDLLGLGETVTLVYEVVGAGAAPTMVGTAVSAGTPQPVQGGWSQPAYASPPSTPAPIAQEEETQPDRNRWIVIGCGVLTLVFCCVLVIAVIYIDSNSLWCELPLSDMIFNCP